MSTKWWCNDYCPLVPKVKYRKGNKLNTNNWSFHWLILHIWSLDQFAFEVKAEINLYNVSVGVIVPYLRVFVGVRRAYSKWTHKLNYLLSRKPAIKLEQEAK